MAGTREKYTKCESTTTTPTIGESKTGRSPVLRSWGRVWFSRKSISQKFQKIKQTCK